MVSVIVGQFVAYVSSKMAGKIFTQTVDNKLDFEVRGPLGYTHNYNI